jgi:lysophospholipase L1-like esterase
MKKDFNKMLKASLNGGSFFTVTAVAFLSICSFFAFFAEASSSTKGWVGTWGCAPYAAGTNTPPSPYLANNTLRQIVRVSIGGDTIRVRFSNATCSTPVTMKSVNIAVSPDGTASAITDSTRKQLKFSGDTSVTMTAGGTATSDPIAFHLTPSMRVAITIYYGQCTISSDMTHHYGSRTDSYILTGNQTANAAFSGDTTVVERWYHITNIDVWADTAKTHAVVCLGNSITDAYGLHGGLQNRWTDMFSQKLLANTSTANVGVLNMGIGGTNVSGTGATTGATRFQKDVLDQSGVKWLIVFYGINDIGSSNLSADTITSVYKKMVTAAHAKDIKVYGATLTPVNGNSYYSTTHEAVRAAVNKWIRTSGNFDTCIDFDHTIRDPSDSTKLQAAYSNDWLHPNAAGYQLLGESIDLSLFALPTVNLRNNTANTEPVESKLSVNNCKGRTLITFEIPYKTFVSLKVYSMQGKEEGELAGRDFSAGRHTVEFKNGNLAKGIYLYSLKAGKIWENRVIMN